MQTVENQLFDSVTVAIDGRCFVRCTLINCELRYCGGEFEMVNTLVSDCKWAFGGSARRTMEVIERFEIFGEGVGMSDEAVPPPLYSQLVN